MFNRLFTIICLNLMITSCATLTKEECLHADWQLIGFEDGTQGRLASYLGEHREACAQYGVIPLIKDYQKGRTEGLNQYCKPYHGYTQGLSGASYQGVCPKHLEGKFLTAYHFGKSIYSLETDIKEANSKMNHNQSRLEDIKNQIKQKEAKVIANGLNRQQRSQLLSETKALAQEQGELEQETKSLIAKKAQLEAKVRHLKQRSRY